jgi:hypothetical protein
MNRRRFLHLPAAAAAAATFRPLAVRSDEAAALDPEAPPRWGFLGDDEGLTRTIDACGQVLLICVYETTLEDVKPPFAGVVLRATVVQAVKGTHKTGDRIVIRFHTDSLPLDDAARAKFIEAAAVKNLGSLKMAFLPGARADEYECDWLDIPSFKPEMLDFTIKHQATADIETK